MEMKYTVYKIVNKVNGKIYIGCHKTTDLEDGYMGSGKILKRAIDKYGLENFEKEILEVFDNPDDMFEMEAKLVNHKDPNTYNIKRGGQGGFDFINENSLNIGLQVANAKRLNVGNAQIHNDRMKSDPEYRKQQIDKIKRSQKESGFDFGAVFRGKTHSDETKKKIGLKNSINQRGKNNSNYGNMWVTDGLKSRLISKADPIPDGWRKGRVMTK